MSERHYVKPGATVALVASYSEAACHTRIAGRPVVVTLEARGDALGVSPGTIDGHGLTLGEIGFYHDRARGWYVPAEQQVPPQDLDELLARQPGVLELVTDDDILHTARLYVGGELAETAFLERTDPEAWRISFKQPDGRPTSRVIGGRYDGPPSELLRRMILCHHLRRPQISVIVTALDDAVVAR